MIMVDICIIGSGAAATATLIELCEKLLNGPKTAQTLHITVIDKYPEFWRGIPYGSRSSVNALTITAVTDFVSPGKEQSRFFAWLKANREELFENYLKKGGMAANKWLLNNIEAINAGDWKLVYLPRFMFGIYMQHTLETLLKAAEENQLVKASLIHAEAIDVELLDNGIYKTVLECADKSQSVLECGKLVIATGSAPVKNYGMPGDAYVYINDIYEPSVNENIKTMSAALAHATDVAQRNLLLIGSNASSIEFLYLLNNLPELKNRVNKIVAISRRGAMPAHISEDSMDVYPRPNLDKLKADGGYDIHMLGAAMKKDLELASDNDTVVVPYVGQVVGYTLQLMDDLGEEARKIFFGVYGPQVTGIIRRSGPAYKGAAVSLLQADKLQMLKGSFTGLSTSPIGAAVNYKEQDTGESKTGETSFKVVINCTGAELLENSPSRLLYNLTHKNLCRVNLTGVGFEVNERFEAAPHLYIMGPLLGGNMNKLIHFWHLENVSRLLYLAPFLADCLLEK